MAHMLSREELENLARLARLDLSEAELGALGSGISSVLGYVAQVSAVEFDATKPIAPLVHNVMREDVVRDEHDQVAGTEPAIRASFPKEKNGYNVVRKIIQKDE